jgi:hypothetical protein
MRTIILGLAGAALLAACSDDSATTAKPEEARADQLKPGEYEITATVDALRSTDKTTPATKSKVGDPPKVTRTCVPADGTIPPDAFAETDEKCRSSDSYMRGGRMNLQFKCVRDGEQLTQMADGSFTADSFTGTVMTATYLSGSGDYELTRTMTGKRVGDCPAPSAPGAPAAPAAPAEKPAQ